MFINNSDSNARISSIGNVSTINFNPPIILDSNKTYSARVLSAQILYCFSNIFTGINNKLYYSFNGTSYIITFTAGLYSLDNINETISIQTLSNNDNGNLINIQGNNATSSVYIIFDSPTLSIDCSQNDSISQILGFPTSTGVIGPFVDQTYYTLGNLAQLNTTSSLNIVSDLNCTNSYKNGNTSNVMASVLINADPFNTIDYEPHNCIKSVINKKTIETVTVGIYDQNMNNVDMNSDNGTKPYEKWNCVIEINEGII